MQIYSYVHILVVFGALIMFLSFFLQEQVFSAIFTLFFLFYALYDVLRKRKKLNEIMKKYGYKESPLRDPSDFMLKVKQKADEVEVIVGRKFSYFRNNSQWSEVVEVSDAILATDTTNLWYRRGIPDNNRVLVARLKNGKFLIGYLLHNISDDSLQNSLQELRSLGVNIDIEVETTGVF